MTSIIDNAENYFVHNGIIQANSNFTPSLTQGDTVIYEVIRVINSAPVFLTEHLQRLEQSIDKGKLKHIDYNAVKQWIHGLLLQNPVTQKNIKITVCYTDPNDTPNTTIYFIPSKYPTSEDKTNGVGTCTMQATRSNPEIKAENKTLRSEADNLIASSACYEVLLIDNSGLITEGSRSNVFFTMNGKVITAPATTVLGGITRIKILDICQKLGIPIVHECLHIDQIARIDGAFISGTSPGVLPINRIDRCTINANNKLVRAIGTEYENTVKKDIEQYKQHQ